MRPVSGCRERIAELAVRNGRSAHEALTFDREGATRGLPLSRVGFCPYSKALRGDTSVKLVVD